MPREKYYEVPLQAYLFERPESEDTIKPEERVRQWCVHELIRAYGYKITDITFEHQVRYGSSLRRIDILIEKDDKPFIVVECKRQNAKNANKGLEQAINYAGAEAIKADYAVYTNGTDWLVKRCIAGHWSPVADIPNHAETEAELTVDQLYMDLHDAAPLLNKLGERLNPRETKIYFEAMQKFFSGSNLLTRYGNEDLTYSLENLLRSIINFTDAHYCRDKFLASYALLLSYGKKIGAGWMENPPHKDEHPFRYTALYQSNITKFINGFSDIAGQDYHILKLIGSFNSYCHELLMQKERQHPEIPHGVFQSLRDLLDFAFRTEFMKTVPQLDDSLYLPEMKRETSYQWESITKKGKFR